MQTTNRQNIHEAQQVNLGNLYNSTRQSNHLVKFDKKHHMEEKRPILRAIEKTIRGSKISSLHINDRKQQIEVSLLDLHDKLIIKFDKENPDTLKYHIPNEDRTRRPHEGNAIKLFDEKFFGSMTFAKCVEGKFQVKLQPYQIERMANTAHTTGENMPSMNEGLCEETLNDIFAKMVKNLGDRKVLTKKDDYGNTIYASCRRFLEPTFEEISSSKKLTR